MRYLRPYTTPVLVTLFLLIALSGLTLLTPKIIAHAIDTIIKTFDATAGHQFTEYRNSLAKQALFILAIFGVRAIVTMLQQVLLEYVGQGIMFDLRRDVFKRLQELPLSYYDRNPAGRLITRATNDINVINEAFSGVLIYVCRDMFIMVGVLVLLFAMNLELTFFMLIPVPLLVVASALFRPISRRCWRAVRTMVAKTNAFMHESFSGVHIVKMFNREKQLGDEFHAINNANYLARLKVLRVDSLFNSMTLILTSIPISLLLWLGGTRVAAMDLSFGEFYLYLTLLRMLFMPITGIAEKYILMQSAMASGERIFQVIDQPDQMPDPVKPVAPQPFKGSVEFRGVTFSYDGKREILKDVSFKVKPGQTLALVGNTGSGKTTTTSLISRFYDVTGGQVQVSGIDVRDFMKSELRAHIGIVMQEVFIFSSTVRDNVRLSSTDISDEDVWSAIKAVGADEFVSQLPNGLDEVLAERGTGLSVGQRQLLAFARALAHDRAIIVLDEATASVDTKSEMLIQKATELLLKNRTSIVVAHRLSTIKNADRILVFKDGRIVEEGNHAELIAKEGAYFKMYNLQFAQQEDD